MKQYNLSWNSFLSFSDAKIRQESYENKKWSNFFVKLLRQAMYFATKRGYRGNCCRKESVIGSFIPPFRRPSGCSKDTSWFLGRQHR